MIPILVYHHIGVHPPDGMPMSNLFVSKKNFARQMWALKLLGYTGLSVKSLLPYISKMRRGRVFGVTFDDGYLNNFEHALPILIECGFSATCYSVSPYRCQDNFWDQEKGIIRQELMTGCHLREWIAHGMEIGAHTRSHCDLIRSDPFSAAGEIIGSKIDLEDLTGGGIENFCYPYGRFSELSRRVVEAAGFSSAATMIPGRASPETNKFLLPRIGVAQSTGVASLLFKMFGFIY